MNRIRVKLNYWRFPLMMILSSLFIFSKIPERLISYSKVNDNSFMSPADFFSYKASPLTSDTIRVGAGETYTSLTRSGGLFQAFNSGIISLSKNMIILITTDLNEDGSNIFTNTGLNGYIIAIVPSAPIVRNIFNGSDITNSLINMSGSGKKIIDGSYNNTGKFLRFINTHSSPQLCEPTIAVAGNMDSVVIKNVIVESNIQVSNGGVYKAAIDLRAGNKIITITQSEVHNALTGTVGQPDYAIFSNYNGSKLNILNNDIYNFGIAGIWISNTIDSVLIKDNHCYFNMPLPAGKQQTAISVSSNKKNVIENNFVGGSSRNCLGATWLNDGNQVSTNAAFHDFIGIIASSSGTDTTFIKNNTIQNITLTGNVSSFGGIVNYGLTKIIGNTVGHSSNSSSILNTSNNINSNTRGIASGGSYPIEVDNNIVANMTSTGPGALTYVSVHGLYLSTNGYMKVTNNSIYNLSSNSMQGGLSAANAAVTGIYLWSGFNGHLCEGNKIWSLIANSTAKNVEAVGIYVSTTATTGSINRNRIYDLQSFSDSGGIITAIKNPSCGFTYTNNQIALTNGNNIKNVSVRGILSETGPASFYYNSIYIGGTASGNANSYCVKVAGNFSRTDKFFNNLLFNERAGAGGSHFALSLITNNLPINWSRTASNHNVFVISDTAKVAEWGACCSGTPKSMRQWKAATLGDTVSYAALNTTVSSSLFFSDLNSGNLNINNLNSLCWYVNGKGFPISTINADFDNSPGSRSTLISNGSTDIGSDEFNTNTLPIPLIIYGRHILGGADTLSLNERIIAIINWGNSGTLPSIGDARFYSGEWPVDTTNNGTVFNARYMNGYLSVQVSGGSGYSYSLKFFYDSSMLGKTINESTLQLNKRKENFLGSWIHYPTTSVNTILKTITVNNMNSFSEFTATDASATLGGNGSLLLCGNSNTTLTAQISGTAYQWQLDSGGGFVSITDNIYFTGSNTLQLQLSNIPTSWYGYKLRCVIDGINTAVITFRFVTNWLGLVNNLWEEAGNWSCGNLPDENTDVTINNGTVIVNSSAFVRSIWVKPGTEFTIKTGTTLTIKH